MSTKKLPTPAHCLFVPESDIDYIETEGTVTAYGNNPRGYSELESNEGADGLEKPVAVYEFVGWGRIKMNVCLDRDNPTKKK